MVPIEQWRAIRYGKTIEAEKKYDLLWKATKPAELKDNKISVQVDR